MREGATVSAPFGLPERRLLALLSLGLLLAGSTLRAQIREAEEELPPPRQFDLTVEAGERFTSNPEFLPDPTTPDERSPEGDYLSDMRLDLSMSRRTARTDWSLRYSPFYTRYRENSQLNTFNHAFDYDGDYEMSRRWRVILAEHFAYSRDPLHVASAEGGYDPVLTTESTRWRSFSDVGVETDLSRSLTLQTGVSGRVDRFEDPALTDGETWGGRAGLEKRIGRDQTVSVTYGYARFLLTGEDTGGGKVRFPDFSSHAIEAGWAYAAAGRAEFSIYGGASQVTREGERESLFIGSTTYHQPFRHLDLTVGYQRNLSADAGVSTVTVSQNAHAALSANVGRITTLGLTADWGTRESTLSADSSTAAEGTSVDLIYYGAILRGTVVVHDRVSVAADASRRRQHDAARADGDVTVNTCFLGVIFRIF